MNQEKFNSENWSENLKIKAGSVVKYQNGYYKSRNGINDAPPNESQNFTYEGEVERFGSLASKDASNIGENEKTAWLDALDLNDLQVELTSEDESILIENESGNIENNISFLTEEFDNLPSGFVVLDFPSIQILGIYDGGIRLNKTEYTLTTPQRIQLLTSRKATLVDGLTTVLTVDYIHLKTDL